MNAIYGCEVKIIGRSDGRSIVAAAAYRSGTKLFDPRQGKEHDFSSKADVIFSEIMLPAKAPPWMSDRQALWESLEQRERRKDSQLARELILTLPRSLSPPQRVALVRDFAFQNFVKRGMLVDIAIHSPSASDGQPQPHCHILVAMREINQDGWGFKRRDWNPQFSNAGRPKGFVRDPARLVDFRATWSLAVNAAFKSAGISSRVDHRSLAVRLEEKIGIATDQTLSLENRLIAAEEAIDLDRVPQPKSGIAREVARRKGVENASDREKKAQIESEARQHARANWYFWLKKRLLIEAQATARLTAQRALARLKLKALLLKRQIDQKLALARSAESKLLDFHRRQVETAHRTTVVEHRSSGRSAGPELNM
jgi:hypothetical protein